MLPPRQTPHSTMSPGIECLATYRVARIRAYNLSGEVMVNGRTARMMSWASSSMSAGNFCSPLVGGGVSGAAADGRASDLVGGGVSGAAADGRSSDLVGGGVSGA